MIDDTLIVSLIIDVEVVRLETLFKVCPQTHCIQFTNRILRANVRKKKLWIDEVCVTIII